MNKATVARFKKAYASPLDVDLYSGMLAAPSHRSSPAPCATTRSAVQLPEAFPVGAVVPGVPASRHDT